MTGCRVQGAYCRAERRGEQKMEKMEKMKVMDRVPVATICILGMFWACRRR